MNAPARRLYEQRADPTVDPIERLRVEIPEKGELSFGFDAALPTDSGVKFSTSIRPWTDVRSQWLDQITNEDTLDVQTIYYRSPTTTAPHGWFLRVTDGAFCRRAESEGVAYTPRAWSQLVSLLLQEVADKPRSAVDAYRWLGPEVRATVFEHLRDRSHRREHEDTPMLLRTFMSQHGVRTLRAVLSGRHSGRHFDDEALMLALDNVLPHGSQAYVSRAVDHTAGYAVIENGENVRSTINWSNSETGAASLSFAGGCWIDALATVIRSSDGEGTDMDLTRSVRITSAHGSSSRAHTLPRIGVTHSERAQIARDRMVMSIQRASEEAAELVRCWKQALVSFPGGQMSAAPESRDDIAEVMLDLIAERTRSFESDREALKEIIVSSDRLATLPYLSAAHIAGAWALLGATKPGIESATRCQLEAGRWVKERFA